MHDKLRERIMRNTVCDPWSGCWIWMGRRNNGGYGTMSIRVEGVGHPVPFYAHRVAYQVFKKHPRRLYGLQVAHQYKCISQLCCNPAHLRATTHSSNERDKKRAAKWKRRVMQEVPMATRTLLKRVGQLQEERC